MTQDLRDLHPGRPHRRDRHFSAASTRHFVLRDRKFVALARADHELALAAVPDLTGDGAVEETVAESFQHDHFETCARFVELIAIRRRRIAARHLVTHARFSMPWGKRAQMRTPPSGGYGESERAWQQEDLHARDAPALRAGPRPDAAENSTEFTFTSRVAAEQPSPEEPNNLA
jgi:hypothetical protein